MSIRRRTTAHAILALALAGSLWGLTVPLSKLGMDWLDAGWLAVVRFAVAAPLLALFARRHLRAAISPAMIAAALGRGTATAAAWVGSLVALAGVGLVAGGGGAGTSLTGDLLVLASVSGSAAFIVAQPRLLAGRDAGAVTAVQLGAGGVA